MTPRRAALLALAAGLALVLLTPSGAAQEGGSGGSADVSDGYLYLSDRHVDEGDFLPYNPCGNKDGEVSFYGVFGEVPRGTDGAKAYTNAHGGAISCTTPFTYQATEGFKMGAGTHVTFWVGCDRPSPGYSTSREPVADDWRISLVHNGEQVDEYGGDYSFPLEAGLCLPDAPPMRLEAPLEPPETPVAPGDNVTLGLSLFGTVDEHSDFYVAVQSRQTPSALYGPGFPGKLRDSPRSDLLVDPGNRSSAAAPGNATTYPFTVENMGDEARELSLSVDGPEAWFAEPSPASLEVPAGETVEASLTIAAPRDLPSGAEARHLVTVASTEEEVTFGTTTTVVPDAGTAIEEVLDEGALDAASPDGGSDDLSSTGGGSADRDGGGFLDDFGVELAATAVAGLAAFVAKEFVL